MKPLRLIFCLLFLTTLAAAQGSWTLYYSDTQTVNGDGTVTLPPTVGITGDDGGYCNVYTPLYGYETSSVMLNGNAWAIGDTITSGGLDYGSPPVDFAYTFPDVTLPADGTEVDLSYAGKVQGICFVNAIPSRHHIL
jgi:hypothetical protein